MNTSFLHLYTYCNPGTCDYSSKKCVKVTGRRYNNHNNLNNIMRCIKEKNINNNNVRFRYII
jgi:hypothetical protein